MTSLRMIFAMFLIFSYFGYILELYMVNSTYFSARIVDGIVYILELWFSCKLASLPCQHLVSPAGPRSIFS